MKKQIISFILTITLLITAVPVVYADNNEALNAANELYKLGLFNGVGMNDDGTPNFDLDRNPTRHEAITLLVALLGKGRDAKDGSWKTPFADVAEWAKPYVGYAYTNGLTSGTSATAFSGNAKVTASQYITFVLTALGYRNGEDFQWNKAWELSDELGITDGRYSADSVFTRGDAAIISYNALDKCFKGTEATLREELLKLDSVQDAILHNEIQGCWKWDLSNDEYELYYRFWGDNVESIFCLVYENGSRWITCQEGSFSIVNRSISAQFSKGYAYDSEDSYTSISDAAFSSDLVIDDGLLIEVYTAGSGEEFKDKYYRANDAESYCSELKRIVDAHTVTDETLRRDIIGDWYYNAANDDGEIWKGYLSFKNNTYTGGWVKTTSDGKTILYTTYAEGSYSIEKGVITFNESRIYYTEGAEKAERYEETYDRPLNGLGDELYINGWPMSRDKQALNIINSFKKYVYSYDRSVNSEDYVTFARSDFQAVKRQYSTATPLFGYVYAYYDMDGDLCALSYIGYKIGTSNYYDLILHNITSGGQIKDPEGYYESLSKSSSYYMSKYNEVLSYKLKITRAVKNILENGVNSYDGAYLGPSLMN